MNAKYFFYIMIRRTPIYTLFPYTTLFRSRPVRDSNSCRRREREATYRNSTEPSHGRSEEHTSELQSLRHLVCRLLLEKKNFRQMLSRLYTRCLYTKIIHTITTQDSIAI